MLFEAEVIRDVSYDPYYKILFSFEGSQTGIQRGTAEVVRKTPVPVITYDTATDEKLGAEDRLKLDYELMNVVVGYLLSKGTSRTYRGKLVLYTA